MIDRAQNKVKQRDLFIRYFHSAHAADSWWYRKYTSASIVSRWIPTIPKSASFRSDNEPRKSSIPRNIQDDRMARLHVKWRAEEIAGSDSRSDKPRESILSFRYSGIKNVSRQSTKPSEGYHFTRASACSCCSLDVCREASTSARHFLQPIADNLDRRTFKPLENGLRSCSAQDETAVARNWATSWASKLPLQSSTSEQETSTRCSLSAEEEDLARVINWEGSVSRPRSMTMGSCLKWWWALSVVSSCNNCRRDQESCRISSPVDVAKYSFAVYTVKVEHEITRGYTKSEECTLGVSIITSDESETRRGGGNSG